MTEEEITALQTANTELVARVQQLESINVDLKGQKIELKQKLQDGLTDDDAKAEIANLKGLLEATEGEKSQLQTEHIGAMNSMRMRDVLREAGVKAQNADALDVIASQMLDGVTYEDGFKWVNDDGSTRYNEANKPYGVIDRVNELKGGDKSYLFAEAKGGGGGAVDAPAEPQTKDIAEYVRDNYSY